MPALRGPPGENERKTRHPRIGRLVRRDGHSGWRPAGAAGRCPRGKRDTHESGAWFGGTKDETPTNRALGSAGRKTRHPQIGERRDTHESGAWFGGMGTRAGARRVRPGGAPGIYGCLLLLPGGAPGNLWVSAVVPGVCCCSRRVRPGGAREFMGVCCCFPRRARPGGVPGISWVSAVVPADSNTISLPGRIPCARATARGSVTCSLLVTFPSQDRRGHSAPAGATGAKQTPRRRCLKRRAVSPPSVKRRPRRPRRRASRRARR